MAHSGVVFHRFGNIRLPYGVVVVDALAELGIICLLGILELLQNNTPHIVKDHQ